MRVCSLEFTADVLMRLSADQEGKVPMGFEHLLTSLRTLLITFFVEQADVKFNCSPIFVWIAKNEGKE